MSTQTASLNQDLILTDEEMNQELDILQDFLDTLKAKGLDKPRVKAAPKKGTTQQSVPRVVLPDPVPVKILQEYVSFQCASCGSHHRFLMKSLVGYKSGTGIAFREVSEMTDKIKSLLEEGLIESEERHVQVLACSVCGGL